MRMHPSEACVETLVAQGSTHDSGIVGSASMHALAPFPLAGIPYISTAHERHVPQLADDCRPTAA